MAESFFAALKNERVHRTVYPTREMARKDIARYIEFRYNSKRLHSGLGYRTPRGPRRVLQRQPCSIEPINMLSGKRGADQGDPAIHGRCKTSSRPWPLSKLISALKLIDLV